MGGRFQARGHRLFPRGEAWRKWAFVDPEGRLFLSVGPTTVSASAPTTVESREYMFSALPANDPPLVPFLNEKGLDFFSANLRKKYGENFKQAWLDRTYARLASWGFNTIGAFSSWDTLRNGKIPPGSHRARRRAGIDRRALASRCGRIPAAVRYACLCRRAPGPAGGTWRGRRSGGRTFVG